MTGDESGGDYVGTERILTFSDGVFAIAITLLVLNLVVPRLKGNQELAAELAGDWPSYVSYAMSFLFIGIIWANHHNMQVMGRAAPWSRPRPAPRPAGGIGGNGEDVVVTLADEMRRRWH